MITRKALPRRTFLKGVGAVVGLPVLDAMGCQVIRERAKFTPALDRGGKPIRSTYVTPPIRWRMGS